MPDVIVIGGGPGGTAAATRAAQLGAQVTVIERAQRALPGILNGLVAASASGADVGPGTGPAGGSPANRMLARRSDLA